MNYYNILEFVREEKDFFSLYGYEGFETILKSIKNQIKLTSIPLNEQPEDMVRSFPMLSMDTTQNKKLLFGDKQVFAFVNSEAGKNYRNTLNYYRGKGYYITLFHLMCNEFLQKQNNLDENSNNKIIHTGTNNAEVEELQNEIQRLRNENKELKMSNEVLTKDIFSLRQKLSSIMDKFNDTFSEEYDDNASLDDDFDFYDEEAPFFNDEIPEDLDRKESLKNEINNNSLKSSIITYDEENTIGNNEKEKQEEQEEDVDIYSLMSKII